MKPLITALLLGLAVSVSAETRLIIPLATTHIGDQTYVDLETDAVRKYNNFNRGLGLEYSRWGFTMGATYLDKNSYSEHSVYAHISKDYQPINNVVLSFGPALASGYERVSENGLIVAPISSVRFYNIRVVTSYPFGNAFSSNGTDFLNLQYVVKF